MSAIVNHSRLLHEGKAFNLLKENITLPNNITTDLEIIRHPGASAVVPASQANSLILIKQYRHAVGDFIWEIPEIGLDDAIKMIYEGSIKDCKTISGILMAAFWLKKMERYVIP